MCEKCLAGNAKGLPFGKAKRASIPLELIYSNIYGLMNVTARHGNKYFISFMDDFTRYSHIYLISHISEALPCFKPYNAFIENNLNIKINSLRTDWGYEYLSNLFKAYYDDKGILDN